MLQAIRDRATGWIAWIIVGLLIVPFALWGINEYFGITGDPEVAHVNDTVITRTMLARQVDMELRATRNRPEGEALKRFQRAVLERMIREELLVQAATDAGLRISDGQLTRAIRGIEAFQVEGRFDPERFKRVLRENGFTIPAFEEQQRRSMLVAQLVSAIQDSAFATPSQVDDLARLQNRKLDLRLVRFSAHQYRQKIQPDAAAIEAYYKAHAQELVKPAQVKVDYLLLDPKALEAGVEVDEATLRAYYEANRDSWITPGQRHVAHILVTVPEAGKEAEALKKIQEIQARLAAGEDFAKLAREFSEDPGSAKQGGDLGVIEPGSLDPAFEKAANQLKPGEVSGPVRSAYGYHLIKLLSLKPARGKSFEEARAEVEAQYRQEAAEKRYYDMVDKLQDLAYENPQSLDVPAAELNLPIQHSDWFTQAGGKGIARYPAVVKAAFSDEVLAGGDLKRASNSGLIELPVEDPKRPPAVVVLHVADYAPQRPLSLEEARAQIVRRIQAEEAARQMQAAAQAILEQLAQGADLKTLAEKQSLSYQEATGVGRSGSKLGREIVDAAFKLGRVDKGQHRETQVQLGNGDLVVLQVTGMQEGDPAKEPEAMRQFLAQFIASAQGEMDMQSVVAALRAEADVAINESNLAKLEQN